jgi:hypothetical protein
MFSPNPEDHLQDVQKNNSDKSINRIEREHNMKIEDRKVENELIEKQWKCCSFDLHPESSLFFGKLTVSCMVIGLCTFQLISLKDCQYQSLYSSLLSGIITYWLSSRK